jgi:hypothetical protein
MKFDELLAKVKEKFDVVVPKNVSITDIDNVANLLVNDIIKPNIK